MNNAKVEIELGYYKELIEKSFIYNKIENIIIQNTEYDGIQDIKKDDITTLMIPKRKCFNSSSILDLIATEYNILLEEE